MNKINLILICIVFSFVSKMSFAEEIVKSIVYNNKFLKLTVNYDTNISTDVINKSLKIIKENTLNKAIINNIDSLNVTLNILKNTDKVSFSNANKNNCNISLNYDINLEGLLLKNYTTDLSFTYLHEISHCILGKRIFNKGISWEPSLNLSKTKTQEINEQINRLTEKNTTQMQCYGNCLATKIFKEPPPLVVYHEMFADISAMLLLSDCSRNEKFLKQIKDIRENNYLASPVLNMHQSFRVFNYISPKELCSKTFDLNTVSYYTQKSFLDYLEELI